MFQFLVLFYFGKLASETLQFHVTPGPLPAKDSGDNPYRCVWTARDGSPRPGILELDVRGSAVRFAHLNARALLGIRRGV